jgi:hypothetical protein
VGLDALARMRRVQPHFARGGLRTAVVPSDATPDARVIDAAARAEGRSTVHVQHGFVPYQPPGPPGHIDGMVSQRVGTWSETYAEYLRTGAPGSVTATGNPAAPGRPAGGRSGVSSTTLLLVEMPTPLSSLVGARVTANHLEGALEGLAAARPGTHVIVRPHPLDSEHRLYEAAGMRHPELQLSMDAHTPITELFGRVDLCVGAVSTAALQATVAGVPTVLLNATGAALTRPFDGSDDYPVATDPERLAAAIAGALGSAEPPGLEAALTALGSDPQALDRLLTLVSDAAS